MLTREKDRHVAEVSLHVRGDHMLNCRHGRRHVEQRARRRRGKSPEPGEEGERQVGRTQAAGRGGPDAPRGASRGSASTNGPRVIRLTRTRFKPMSLENATLELAASGDVFLLFRNVETDGLSVLLRGQAGEFHLVEPDR